MNQLLARITLKNTLDVIAVVIVALAIIPSYAEVYNISLPPVLLMSMSIIVAILKFVELRLQKRLAEEPSTQQEEVNKKLEKENAVYKDVISDRNLRIKRLQDENARLLETINALNALKTKPSEELEIRGTEAVDTTKA